MERLELCRYYIHFGMCKKALEANPWGLCQTCTFYKPKLTVHIKQGEKRRFKRKEKPL